MSKLIDLFSGIGGFEYGLLNSNYIQKVSIGSAKYGKRNTLPILDCVLFQWNEDGITVSAEDSVDAKEEVFVANETNTFKPKRRSLRGLRRFLQEDEEWNEGMERGSSPHVSFSGHRDDVTKDTRGKEHGGLPNSSVTMSEAVVPPNIPVWRALSEFLIDRMEEAGDLEATTQIVDKADLKTMVSQGMRFRHTVNGVSVTYTDKGTYYVQHYPEGQNLMSRSLQYMTKEIAALIIYETTIDENFRRQIEKLNPPTYSNYKILVEELMEEGYKYNPNFDQDDIDYFDDVRKEVKEIANSLVL